MGDTPPGRGPLSTRRCRRRTPRFDPVVALRVPLAGPCTCVSAHSGRRARRDDANLSPPDPV